VFSPRFADPGTVVATCMEGERPRPAVYSADTLARLLHMHPDRLAAWRVTGRGPRPLRVGGKWYYLNSSVRQWLANRSRGKRVTALRIHPVHKRIPTKGE
jgi:hypothetical protein